MSSANVNVENVLRERSQNFLNVQVSDFLNHQMSNKQSIIMKTSKSNLSPEQNYRIFQRNLELQKQILSDQDVLHSYQTQLFAKQIIKPETCHYVSKRPSTQHFKPTLANEFAIPQRSKKPEMIKNIDKIDEDLEILAQLFYARKLYQKFMKQLELNMSYEIQKENPLQGLYCRIKEKEQSDEIQKELKNMIVIQQQIQFTGLVYETGIHLQVLMLRISSQSRQSLMFHVAQKIISNKQNQLEKEFIVKVSESSINKLPQNKKVNIKPKEKLIMKSEYDLLERCFTEQQRRNSVSETSLNESPEEASIPLYCQKWLLSKFKRNEFTQLQKQYEIMRNIKADTETIKQIEKDIGRTIKSENMENKIKNILATYSVYDPIVGYVQGMNCIASILLHHAKQEWAAFWLFVNLIEQLEIRDVFKLQQTSITKYSKMMEFLIYKYLPQIYHNFIEKQILVQLFLSQWLLSLLMQFIPFDQTQQYIDGLLKEGIEYYFKTCLSILKNLQQNIIEEDQIEILILLTSKQYCQLKWHTILNQQWDIPKGSLRIILDSFDQDADQFQRQLIQQKCSNLIDQFFVFIKTYIE